MSPTLHHPTAEPRSLARTARSLEQQVFIEVMRAADALVRGLDRVLKPAGLSPTQYNVLRILRGAGPGGLSCRETAERMLTHDPDLTRLLDRLEARRLVTRSRQRRDRRVINVRVTAKKGLALLRALDQPVLEARQRQLRHLGRRRLQALARLLAEARR